MIDIDRLRLVFRKALELPPDFAVDDLKYRGVEKWDSLAHMSLVAALEDEFDVMLDTDEVIDLSSFAKAREILGKHGVSFAGGEAVDPGAGGEAVDSGV